MKKGKCGPMCICWILVIIGALNWGLVGIGNFAGGNWDVVQLILGSVEWLRDVVYILVGLSGLWLLIGGCKCKTCKVDGGKMEKPVAKDMPQGGDNAPKA